MEINPKLLRKDVLIISALFWSGGFLLYLAYQLWGASIIYGMYHDHSPSFLGEIMTGRGSHSLEFYYSRADELISLVVLLLFLLPFVYASFALLWGNGTFGLVAPFFFVDLVLPILYLGSFALPDGFLRDFFDLDAEKNLPTWYSSIQLFLVGFLFLVLTDKFFKSKSEGAWAFVALALTFLALSLDEFAGIHEYIGVVSDVLLPGGDRRNTVFAETGIWMFLIAIPFLVFMLYMVAVLRRYINDIKIIRKYTVGLVVFVISAAGIEMLSNFAHAGAEVLQIVAEECGEMLGVTVILWATYDLLAEHNVHIFTRRLSP